MHLLENPPMGGEPFLETVDNRLQWFIHTPSFFFRETASFPSHHADEAAGGIAILGMKLLRLQRLEAAKACGEAIAAIGDRSAAAEKERPYGTADILVKLEQLARAADALGYNALAQEFRVMANRETVSEETLPGYPEAIQIRTRQLDDTLDKLDRDFHSPHDPLPLLRQILK